MMHFSYKRIKAIFIKDLKDLQRNSYTIFTLIIPILFVLFIRYTDEPGIDIGALPINLSLLIVGVFIQAAIVAEEKEKNTLRGLLLSPVKPFEVLVGKSMLSAILAILVMLISMFIINNNIPSPIPFMISIGLSLVIYISLGTLLGLFSRSVMDTSMIGMPVLLIFGMSPIIKALSENDALIKILDYLPNEQLDMIWTDLSNEKMFFDISGNLLILFTWGILSIIITLAIYKKQRFD